MRTALFTPGPSNISQKVKEAMLVDIGSRTNECATLTRNIRAGLVNIGEFDSSYSAVLLQGSGTFAIEAMLSSLVARDSELLILSNGVYAARAIDICSIHNIKYKVLSSCSKSPIDIAEVERCLQDNLQIKQAFFVHYETSLGVLNDADALTALFSKYNVGVFIDVMSSFGLLSMPAKMTNLLAITASSNKGLHGSPGVSFVIGRNEVFEDDLGAPSTLSLDLVDQYQYFKRTGQWRFTPPTHTLLSLNEAINEYLAQGGRQARYHQYQKNTEVLIEALKENSIELYIDEAFIAPIINTFVLPSYFDLDDLNQAFVKQGVSIYKAEIDNGIRIGVVGDVWQKDIEKLLRVVDQYASTLRGNTNDRC